MNLLNKKISSIISWAIGSFIPVVASAQLKAPDRTGTNLPDYGSGGLQGFLVFVIRDILIFAGSIAVLFVIIGGYQYIFSGGNEDMAKRGKTTLTNAIIGLVIIILSFTIISIVYNTISGNGCAVQIGQCVTP